MQLRHEGFRILSFLNHVTVNMNEIFMFCVPVHCGGISTLLWLLMSWYLQAIVGMLA